ncbi:MAG: T9SS type A sorting domain-containing protein, partial [Ignavibacteria bacterium]
ILGGNSFLSSDDPELVFGIGTASTVDSMVIRWTNGAVDRSFNIQGNGRYTAIEGSGVIGIEPISGEIPVNYRLSQNYPNPFNPATKISFSIPNSEFVQLSVFDILGREVSVILSQNLKAGSYAADFNASSLTSGIYFYRLTAGNYTETRKMTLVK